MNRRDGFTLIETIFSSLFIGVTVLAIINLFPGAYLSIKQSETVIQADMFATSILEDLRSNLKHSEFADFEGPLKSSSGLPLADLRFRTDREPFKAREIGGVNYTPTVTFHAVDQFDSQSLVRVRVAITYRINLSVKETVHETLLHAMTVRNHGFFMGRPK